MKILKMIGLLFAVCFINNLQSMMLPQDEFSFERQFLEGDISSDEYLSYLASLYPDYAYKIRDIRNMQGRGPQWSYEDVLERLDGLSAMAQEALKIGNLERYNTIVQKARKHIMKTIDVIYKTLKEGVYRRYGRES